MFAIIGLGNPGRRYEETRHNVGASVVAMLAGGNTWQEKAGSLYTKVAFGTEAGILILPQRYMNLSGQAAAPLIHFYKVPVEQIVVVHDELDLEPGVLRFKQGGSAAGHRGVQDIQEVLGSSSFLRVRIGIGHPRRASIASQQRMEVSDWVLARPGPEEKELIDNSLRRAMEAIPCLIAEGLQVAQQKFH